MDTLCIYAMRLVAFCLLVAIALVNISIWEVK